MMILCLSLVAGTPPLPASALHPRASLPWTEQALAAPAVLFTHPPILARFSSRSIQGPANASVLAPIFNTADEIYPRVFIGGAPVVETARHRLRITAVLNLVDDTPSEHRAGSAYLKAPLIDELRPLPSEEALQIFFAEALPWLSAAHRKGHQILIHCGGGIVLSAMTAIAFLSFLHPEWPINLIEEHILRQRKVRPLQPLHERILHAVAYARQHPSLLESSFLLTGEQGNRINLSFLLPLWASNQNYLSQKTTNGIGVQTHVPSEPVWVMDPITPKNQRSPADLFFDELLVTVDKLKRHLRRPIIISLDPTISTADIVIQPSIHGIQLVQRAA